MDDGLLIRALISYTFSVVILSSWFLAGGFKPLPLISSTLAAVSMDADQVLSFSDGRDNKNGLIEDSSSLDSYRIPRRSDGSIF